MMSVMDEYTSENSEVTTLLDLSPAALLHVIADAFNQLSDMGELVDIRFNSIMTNYGFVLQDDDGVWSAKLKVGESPSWWATRSKVDPDDF